MDETQAFGRSEGFHLVDPKNFSPCWVCFVGGRLRSLEGRSGAPLRSINFPPPLSGQKTLHLAVQRHLQRVPKTEHGARHVAAPGTGPILGTSETVSLAPGFALAKTVPDRPRDVTSTYAHT